MRYTYRGNIHGNIPWANLLSPRIPNYCLYLYLLHAFPFVLIGLASILSTDSPPLQAYQNPPSESIFSCKSLILKELRAQAQGTGG